MKQRIITSVIALSLLATAPAWGQTTIIRRSKKTQATTNPISPDIPRIKKNGLTYEVLYFNNFAAVVPDDDLSNPKMTGVVDIPEYVQYKGRNYPVTSIQCSFPKANKVKVPAQVERLWGMCHYAASWKSVEIDSRNIHFSSLGNAIFDKNFTKLIRVSQKADGTFEIPSDVVTIEGEAFSWCQVLDAVIVPSSVKVIGSRAFEFCYSLSVISIPASVEEIGDEVFYGDSSLVSIDLPKRIKKMGNNMFRDCSKLRTIRLPEGIKSISGYYFSECKSLSSVYLPDGLESIRNYAFYRCESLKEVSIPSSLIGNIEEGAFDFCDKLKSLTVRYPGGTTKIVPLKEIPFKARWN